MRAAKMMTSLAKATNLFLRSSLSSPRQSCQYGVEAVSIRVQLTESPIFEPGNQQKTLLVFATVIDSESTKKTLSFQIDSCERWSRRTTLTIPGTHVLLPQAKTFATSSTTCEKSTPIWALTSGYHLCEQSTRAMSIDSGYRKKSSIAQDA